jgi:hypothetical protein
MMSKSEEFIKRLNKYGADVIVHNKPTTSKKCSCWLYGWPDKDCELCGGKGYTDIIKIVETKAFIFPLRDSDKQLDFINIGVAIGGQIMAYFSPEFELSLAEYVFWDDIKYKVTGVDRASIGNEMIYRSCHLDKVD